MGNEKIKAQRGTVFHVIFYLDMFRLAPDGKWKQ